MESKGSRSTILYTPSKSAEVPTIVPLMKMAAKPTPSPVAASVTLPLTVMLWANEIWERKRDKSKRVLRTEFIIVLTDFQR
jgi:hypothetical protein